MKKKRHFLLAGALVIAAGIVTSCSDGKSEIIKAAEELPTDGYLGEMPKTIAVYEAYDYDTDLKIVELAKKEKTEEIAALREAQHARKDAYGKKMRSLWDSLKVAEIPVVAAEGLPLQFTYYKFTGGSSGAGEGVSQTADKIAGLIGFAYDTDGNVIDKVSISPKDSYEYKFTVGGTFNYSVYPSFDAFSANGYARLAKIVIMDQDNEEAKKLKEEISAKRKEYSDKKREALWKDVKVEVNIK